MDIDAVQQRPGDLTQVALNDARGRTFSILIDELSLSIVPVLLGEGIPLFPSGFPQRDFVLVENNTVPPGLCRLKYKRVR
jgi:hypothetical protein